MTERPEVRAHYGKVKLSEGPAIYSSKEMYDAMYRLGNFAELSTDSKHSFIDLMAGRDCLVALELKKRATGASIDLDVHCLDLVYDTELSEEERAALESQGLTLVSGDIRTGIPYEAGMFRRATTRFGVKNYQPEDQKRILGYSRHVLENGGYLVLADMIAPDDPISREWMQEERRHKGQYTAGGGNIHHHVPTHEMWHAFLRGAGFATDINTDYIAISSVVPRVAWTKSDQMSVENAAKHEQWLLGAPVEARRDFNIRQEEVEIKGVPTTVTKIDYPIIAISARAA